MTRQAPFTEYEAVLLLDAYLRTMSGMSSQRNAVKNCSKALRQMAINRGSEIEDAYRNTGGISFQMASMESAYRGETIIKPATKLFAETVSLYRNDHEKYEEILKEARLMAEDKSIQYIQKEVSAEDVLEKNTIPNNSILKSQAIRKTVRDSFYQWLMDVQKLSAASCRSYASAISVAEQYAVEKLLVGTRFFGADADEAKRTADALFADADFVKRNEGQHNRFKTAITKYFAFIEEEWVPSGEQNIVESNMNPDGAEEGIEIGPFETVLAEKFPRGYRLGSSLEKKKFRRYFEEITGHKLDLNSDVVEKILRRCGIEYEGKVYSPNAMLSDDLKEKLFAYIDKSFEDGRSVLYFEALFREFSEGFLDHNIYNAEMLKAYISYVAGENYYMGRGYLAMEKQISVDPIDDIRTCLKEHGLPMDVEDLCKTLSHIPSDRIRAILGAQREFVRNSKGEYFHVDSFSLSDEELENIADLITGEIDKHAFVSGNELYDAIKGKYPYIYERNAVFSVIGWRDALKFKLGDRFSFTGNIISGKDKEFSMSDVYAAYGAEQKSFSLSELLAFSENMGSTIYFDSLYQNAARVSQEQFVSRDDVNFQVEETDKVLDRFCTGNYLALPEVKDFGIFPEASHPWTPYLLEQYVAFHSENYYLVHGGYNRNVVVGAMVKKGNVYETFDDLVVDILTESDVSLNKKDVLNYLSDNGYIARRSYTGIETLMIKARANRNKKEK
jgi:hypothetical protein